MAIRNSPGNPSTAEIRPEFVNGEFERLYSYCEQYNVPLFFSTHGQANLMEPVIQAHPGLTIVIDHLGLGPVAGLADGDGSWDKLPNLIALAEVPQRARQVLRRADPLQRKVPLQRRLALPAPDFDAFTPDRLFWGSDYTRMRGFNQRPFSDWWYYSDVLNCIRDTNELSAPDKEKMLGGAIEVAALAEASRRATSCALGETGKKFTNPLRPGDPGGIRPPRRRPNRSRVKKKPGESRAS